MQQAALLAAAPPPPQFDIESLLSASDEELMELPHEIAEQVRTIKFEIEEQQRKDAEDRQRRVAELGRMVVDTYNQRVTQRGTLEERWRKAIRRYNGEYEPDVQKALESRIFGSRVFVPLARRVINVVDARLIDLLFPTEERNFAIDSSPVPQLVQAENLVQQLPQDAALPAGPNGEMVPATAIHMGIKELREEAKAKAQNMEREVDDQLRQANYGAVGRACIREGMIMGTGVLKGPMVLNRTKKVWTIKPDGSGSVEMIEDLSPTVSQPSIWDFFPDMSARKLKDSESEIERHYLTRAQLAKLAQQPGFDEDAIRIALTKPASHRRDPMRDQLRESAGTQGIPDNRYLMLEFHGPVDLELLQDMDVPVPDDPLLVYEAVLFVLEDGTVVKAVIEPMDTQERPYSVWCWEEDPACIFGNGLCDEVADMVEACNSSFRAAMDNMGLAVGPQAAINDKDVVPENGRWEIEPRKVWRGKRAGVDMNKAIAFFNVETRLNELMSVFDRSKQLIDDIGGPVMAMQGQEAPSYLDTARGASIAWNASNIWMRRAVRNYDDNITSTMVPRFVDFNMQYSRKPEIKGDHQVLARGVAALLENEGQNTKVQLFLQQASAVPMPYARRINQLRAFARSMRLDPVDLLPDDAEVRKTAQQVDNQPPPPNPEVERIKLRQAEIEDNAAQRAHELQVENGRNNIRLAEIASREGLTAEAARQKYGIEELKIGAQLQDRREQRAHDAQALNAELAVKATTGSGV